MTTRYQDEMMHLTLNEIKSFAEDYKKKVSKHPYYHQDRPISVMQKYQDIINSINTLINNADYITNDKFITETFNWIEKD